MSRFLYAFEQNPERIAEIRERFTRLGRGFLHSQQLTEHLTGHAWLGCWASARVPQSSAGDADGRRAWVLGLHDRCADAGRQAAVLLDEFRRSGIAAAAGNTGFFAAMLAEPDRTWFVADQLGLCPVYYADTGGSVWVASSPGLILDDPRFRRELDVHGLVGHLLTMHEALNQPLWQGIKRLPAGHGLRVEDGRTSAVGLAPLPVGDGAFGLPLAGQMDTLAETLHQVFQPMRGARAGLLLSGGLDSRMVAGFLREAAPAHVETLTLGAASDLEARCARRVTRLLRWPSRLIEVPPDSVPEDARIQLAEEHLANGLSDTSWWRIPKASLPAMDVLLTGFLGDPIVGGSHVNWAYDPATRRFDFTTMFRSINRWGLSPACLRSLLLPRWHGAIDEVIGGLKDQFEGLPGAPFQKAWAFDLLNRQRYHVAGSARRISHAIWPAFPLADQRVLAWAGNMPASPLMFRQLQFQLFIQRFPDLARLPADNNSYRPRALIESLPAKFAARTTGALSAAWHRKLGGEKRYYYRVYDINNSGWRALRNSVHRAPAELEPFLDGSVLKKIIGDARQPIRVADGIIDTSGIKTLLGLCLLMASLEPGKLG